MNTSLGYVYVHYMCAQYLRRSKEMVCIPWNWIVVNHQVGVGNLI